MPIKIERVPKFDPRKEHRLISFLIRELSLKLAVMKKQKQEFGDIEVSRIRETEYERRGGCVETAGELEVLTE